MTYPNHQILSDVELCIEAGLVWGEELYFDSTNFISTRQVKKKDSY